MASFKVSTKVDKAAQAKDTVVEVVYDSPEAERGLATQALIVKAQGHWRKHGIPANCTLKLSEFAPGTRHAGPTLQEAVKVLTPAERAALIAQLQAMK